MEGTILELLRKKELEEANYRYYAARLEQSRINEALGTGKVSNISDIQKPTPPAPDRKKLMKILVGMVCGGFGFGLAWAFAIELFLDHSVRRPIDVERMLGLPLFLSIPVIGKKLKRQKADSLGGPLGTGENQASAPASTALVKSDLEQSRNLVTAHLLHFHETLRDRLISYFESVNLTHKPKLVAVTGLDHGSGVTTTAAGLASCLSETGEGNVLLVDMTAGQGSAQQFYRGKQVCGLEEILSSRSNAQVEDNLFVVVEEPGRDRLSRILPQRFNKLVPQLKASNFDYIIFDMPPVSQISITPRLASFMDIVLLVIESEKTNRDLVERATALLTQSKAHVGAVLNKSKNYVPKSLHQDSLSNF
jgi:Mrp family chromosome partitioning ATPase